MRAMWKGTVSFGLVAIGVRMYAATQSHGVSLHQVRRTDGSRVRQRRVAEADGEEVPFADVAKGYELDDGRTVILTDDDLAALPLPTQKVIDVDAFVPLEQVDRLLVDRSYYLEPDPTGLKPYLLLRAALGDAGLVAVVKIAIGQREHVATIRVHDDVLVLETLRWPDEVRVPDFDVLSTDVTVSEREQTMADSLVSQMTADFDPDDYRDDYARALRELVAAKQEGGEVVAGPDTAAADEGDDNVVDMMAALQASIDRATGGTAGKKAPATKAAAKKKPAAKKTSGTKKTSATKKPAAKKTPARKTAARKTAAKAS